MAGVSNARRRRRIANGASMSVPKTGRGLSAHSAGALDARAADATAGGSPPGTSQPPTDQALGAADTFLDLLPIATAICDLDGRVVRFNRRAVEIWGRAPRPGETHDQFTARSKFYASDGRAMQRSLLSESLRTGVSVRDQEITVERPGGDRISVLVSIDPLFDSQGRRWGAIWCLQDVTERNRAIEALDRSRQDLRQQQERWNATYEHAAIGIVELDAEGRFMRVNEAICSIIGFTREELLGWRLFNATHPNDRDNDEEMYRKQVEGEIGDYSLEKRFIRKDGRVIWVAIRSSTVRDAAGRFLYAVRVVQDVTERREFEQRQKLLIDELNHRVKNTLATVQSLATQTARGTDTPEEFRSAFEGRLIALSQAHDQLTRRHWTSADLRDLVAASVLPHVTEAEGRIALEGCAVTVAPRIALTLALALHELTTNAAKYGALSNPAGRIAIRWRVRDGDLPTRRLWIEWSEQGGPEVSAPRHQGFGTRFIVGSVSAELQGTARLDFAAEGLRCTMEIPIAVGAAKSKDSA
ncbi:MAG: PAS domain S-box protein [Alphaproteobacteria bacterium]|nr:PAS domain S-box protein [Alphaproteobacteria bacterium]